MNCDLLNSFKVLQIICQVIACFFINRKTTPTTPAISQNRHYPADKIYHHSNTNHRLCQIAFLKLFNLCCHSAGFLLKIPNIVTFLWGMSYQAGTICLQRKSARPLCKLSPKGSVADMRRAWRNGPVAVCDGGPYWI